MRMIDAKSAKEALECTLVGDAAALAQRVIDRMPTIDAVPVVRCRECKYWQRNFGVVDSPNGHCFYLDFEMNGHDFCSYGERKDSAE